MAQHDYIIANQSGAAFRADLNVALAAVATNNSQETGPSQPDTTYRFQWWADPNTGLLKIRNAANNAWITVGTLADANLGLLSLAGGTLTGALLLDDSGTVSAPALAFDGDANTGIWRSAADTLNVATNGVENLEFGTSEVVFNDGGADIDFRIEGDTKANLFKVDAGTDTVIIDGLTQPSADGTADQALVTNGSGVLSFASRSRLTQATSVSAGSGTSIDFTSLPSWARRITVMFDRVSTNGSSEIQVLLGDSGGIESTNYLGSVTASGTGSGQTVTTVSYSSGFTVTVGTSAASIYSGQLILTNFTGNYWVASGTLGKSDSAFTNWFAGSKELSAVLDRVRITTTTGTDTFDGGNINIIYEG